MLTGISISMCTILLVFLGLHDNDEAALRHTISKFSCLIMPTTDLEDMFSSEIIDQSPSNYSRINVVARISVDTAS